MTEPQIPGVLYCHFPGCGFKSPLQGGGQHHTTEFPGHWMSDAPLKEIVSDDYDPFPITPEIAERVNSHLVLLDVRDFT